MISTSTNQLESHETPAGATERIGLVVPYYEAGEGLTKALESIHLEQRDLILVVDDGSTATPASTLVPDFVGQTPVKLVIRAKNGGITKALQTGINVLAPEYDLLARLDCGDVCRPDRFSIQRDLFANNQELGLVGSWTDFVTPDGKLLYTAQYPEDSRSIIKYMRINSAFCHPTIMMRRKAYEECGGYSEKYPAAEDYALFRRIASKFDSHNIQQSLVSCQTNDGGISQTHRKQQLRTRIAIMIEEFDWHPLAFYGIARAVLQMLTPRSFTTLVRSSIDRLKN